MTTCTSTNTITNLFPNLHSIYLINLTHLKHIGGGGGAKGSSNEISFRNTTKSTVIDDQVKFSQVGVLSWSLCQYSREISITDCHALSSAIPSYALGKMQKLEEMTICRCTTMTEVFETQGIGNSTNGNSTNIDGGSFCTNTTPAISRIENINLLKLPNLKILEIKHCDVLEYIFTFCALDSLKKLEKLKIMSCKAMKVIVREENKEQTTASEVVFPRLKSIALINLPNLVGFFLGKNEFRWPILDDVLIKDCPQMMVFTYGHSTTTKLKYIHTQFGKRSLECGLNFHVETTLNKALQSQFPSLDDTSFCPANFDRVPWSFQNFIVLEMVNNQEVKKIIPSNQLLQLQKLEKNHVNSCHHVEELFEGRNSGINESQTVVKFPNLRDVNIVWLKI